MTDLTAVLHRPILFSGAMVRAILEDRKTQARRVIKPAWSRCLDLDDDEDRAKAVAQCPYGTPGGRLWVRETWAYVGPGSGSDAPFYLEERQDPVNHISRNCWYAADERHNIKWTPSIHMPKWASRITLEVTDVRVERVQDISEEDAKAEGCDKNELVFDAREAFQYLWNDINGPRGYGWQVNPWVWVVEFKRVSS